MDKAGKLSLMKVTAISHMLCACTVFFMDWVRSDFQSILDDRCLEDVTELLRSPGLLDLQVNHFRFYEACKRKRAVKEAFTFLKLLRSESTLRNYTMLLSVCCHAQDIDGEHSAEAADWTRN